ncbi:hypothetical protein CVT24_009270 [Panaeolus cyanescens]|uniref:DUF6593 domain-containing protein n=1 Tax=Panaeolus cyanescens TaxID=181874 RepID=A0A409Y880_9AGAR|nr:hypothetical protein CVT24_009270 [Panaeolus cyanescens]
MSFNIYLTSKWDTAADGIWTTHEGQELYRTIDPWTSSTVTIERATASGPNATYSTLATLRFRDFHSDVLKFGGNEYKEGDFFRKGPMFTSSMKDFFNWGRDRIFTGPDNVEYAWKLRKHAVELHLNDDSKTPKVIATFHPKKSSLMGLRRGEPAYLEIMPEGQHMIDLIFITFIYAEKIRYDRELSSAAGKAGVKLGNAVQ